MIAYVLQIELFSDLYLNFNWCFLRFHRINELHFLFLEPVVFFGLYWDWKQLEYVKASSGLVNIAVSLEFGRWLEFFSVLWNVCANTTLYICRRWSIFTACFTYIVEWNLWIWVLRYFAFWQSSLVDLPLKNYYRYVIPTMVCLLSK